MGILKKKKKLSFTLIEVLISSILLALIVSGLYFIYITISVGTTSIERVVHKERKTLLNSRKIRHYLMSIIPFQNNPPNKGSTRAFFLTEGVNGSSGFQVYADIDNGPDPVPSLSNEVLGKFYINKDNNFILTLVSHPIRAKVFSACEADVLLWKGVESILWEFTCWPDIQSKRDQKTGNTGAIDAVPKGTWVTEWKREWMYTPPEIIRLTLFLKDKQTVIITSVQTDAIQILEFLKESG